MDELRIKISLLTKKSQIGIMVRAMQSQSIGPEFESLSSKIFFEKVCFSQKNGYDDRQFESRLG